MISFHRPFTRLGGATAARILPPAPERRTFGYVVQGEMLFEREGQPPHEIRARAAFRGPGGDVAHYLDRNNQSDTKFWFVITMRCPRAAYAKPGLDVPTTSDTSKDVENTDYPDLRAI